MDICNCPVKQWEVVKRLYLRHRVINTTSPLVFSSITLPWMNPMLIPTWLVIGRSIYIDLTTSNVHKLIQYKKFYDNVWFLGRSFDCFCQQCCARIDRKEVVEIWKQRHTENFAWSSSWSQFHTFWRNLFGSSVKLHSFD